MNEVLDLHIKMDNGEPITGDEQQPTNPKKQKLSRVSFFGCSIENYFIDFVTPRKFGALVTN